MINMINIIGFVCWIATGLITAFDAIKGRKASPIVCILACFISALFFAERIWG